MCVLKFILETLSPYKFYVLGMIGCIFLVALDANIKPYLIKMLIDTATGTPHSIPLLVSIYAVAQFLMIGAWSLSDWCVVRYTSHFRSQIMLTLTERLGAYSYAFFQDYPGGQLSAKISDAFNLIPTLVFTAIYQFIHCFLFTLLSLILLTKVHFLFALGLFVWVSFFLMSLYVGMKKVAPLTAEAAEAKTKVWGYLTDSLTNILNIKYFSTQHFELNQLKSVSQNFIHSNQRQGYFLLNFYLVGGVIVSLYTLSFLGGLLYLHHQNMITPGDFALIFMLNFRVFDKLYELSHQLRDFASHWGTVDQALDILTHPLEIQDKPNAQRLLVPHGEIIFEDVHFHYKDAEPLFQHKSIKILPGQKIGLVGYSGSGKSTFVNLILRLYDIRQGRILIDQQDIREVTQESLRKAIGMIPQDPTLFHRTLMENIRYGRLEASDEEVIEAAKKAHAHEFIERLSKGYDSLVGERGVKLSGGQRQRIALARAILKDPPILILDEATSQLDSVTESKIQESLEELMKGKTVLIIAHRLSTLLNVVDHILVFDQGKIVEEGTHKKLHTKNSLYKKLWDAQMSGFLPEMRADKESFC